MLLTVRHLSRSFGAVTVLYDCSFVVNAGDRTGVVGINGAGKSTLLRILAGHESADGGEQFVAGLIGYGLFRLEDMPKTVQQLSLGQRRKLEIACMMTAHPNVLILDEPTNFLSLDVLEAFEAAVLTFPGPVLAVSHDRWFIERFNGEVWDLVDGQLVRQV